MEYIFVIAIDHGCEGHTPPIQAFLSEGDAQAGLALANSGSHGPYQLYKVPVWPNFASEKYWDIVPHKLSVVL
jgi:hypothetical protein